MIIKIEVNPPKRIKKDKNYYNDIAYHRLHPILANRVLI